MIRRIGFTVLAVLALSLAAQAADMFSGTWVMNVAKSTSSNGNLRRSLTQVISMDGGWQIVKGHGVDKDGKATSRNLISKSDGVARPEIGNGPDSFGMLTTDTQSDDFHAKSVSIAITGKRSLTQVLVISPDGKVKTRTDTRVDKDGKTSKDVTVFDKQ
ncbi:MAG: hypothetical protein EBY17_09105 [Acidobacteriia bacterium]|nr:hypothetical protein [Terriglobia bacterium]